MLLISLVFWAGPNFASESHSPGKIYLYAAASLQEALEKLAAAYTRKTGIQVILVTASSGDLARQTGQGAPANLFISASVEWMDYLEKHNLTQPGSRRALLGNQLVMVTSPCAGKISASIAALLEQHKDSRFAMANPDTSPAGAYAKQALIKLGLWENAASRAVYAEDARAALNWVARCETALGIVYRSDALPAEKLGLSVAAIFPPGSHEPIVYPMALIAGHVTPEAQALSEYLASEHAFAVFESFGFTRP